MTEDTRELGKWVQDLINRAVQDQVKVAQRYGEVLQRAARGDLEQPTFSQENVRVTRDEAARFARSLAALSVSYLNSVLELSRTFSEHLSEQFLNPPAGGGEESAEGEPSSAQIPVELSAPVGEEASASFIVENKRRKPANISFLVSEFVGRPGEPLFRPPLRIEPPRFPLDPGQEREVKLRLPLLPEFFVPNKHYSATVVVSGHENMQVALDVRALAPAAPKRAGRKAPAEDKKNAQASATSRPKRKPAVKGAAKNNPAGKSPATKGAAKKSGRAHVAPNKPAATRSRKAKRPTGK